MNVRRIILENLTDKIYDEINITLFTKSTQYENLAIYIRAELDSLIHSGPACL